jgi:hypothetical protein
MEYAWSVFWRGVYLSIFLLVNALVSVLLVVAVLSNFYVIDVGSWLSVEYTSVQKTVSIHDGYLSITSGDEIPFEIWHEGSSSVSTRIIGSVATLNKSIEFGSMSGGVYSVDSSLTTTGDGDIVISSSNRVHITSATTIAPFVPLNRRLVESKPSPALEVHGSVILGPHPEDDVYIGGVLRANTVNLTSSTIVADTRHRKHSIQNITIANLLVSNVRFDQGRLSQVSLYLYRNIYTIA